MTKWSIDDAPSQEGRTWVITGANTGLGLETAIQVRAKKSRGKTAETTWKTARRVLTSPRPLSLSPFPPSSSPESQAARLGARVILACRSEERGAKAVEAVVARCGKADRVQPIL